MIISGIIDWLCIQLLIFDFRSAPLPIGNAASDDKFKHIWGVGASLSFQKRAFISL